MSDLFVKKAADISPCGLYRYFLSRYWGPGEMLPFVMLNPSTADAEIDDPTIRRCMSFARRERFGGIAVVNLYGLRASDPKQLRDVGDPFGPNNECALRQLADVAQELALPVVCAWGAGGAIHDACTLTVEMFQQNGARLVCLGKTKDGHPRHPLYVRADQQLEPFP